MNLTPLLLLLLPPPPAKLGLYQPARSPSVRPCIVEVMYVTPLLLLLMPGWDFINRNEATIGEAMYLTPLLLLLLLPGWDFINRNEVTIDEAMYLTPLLLLLLPGWDFINRNELTIGEAMSAGGYRTAHFGKWHNVQALGYEPWHNGFEVRTRRFPAVAAAAVAAAAATAAAAADMRLAQLHSPEHVSSSACRNLPFMWAHVGKICLLICCCVYSKAMHMNATVCLSLQDSYIPPPPGSDGVGLAR
jgi:hypothetical protein